MRRVLKAITGICILVGVATALGIASNALRQDGLPLIRKPLRETRAVVGKEQLMANAPTLQSTKMNPLKVAVPHVVKPDLVAVASVTNKQRQAEPKKPVPVVASAAVPTPSVSPKPQKRGSEGKPQPAPKKIQALFTNLEDAKACFDSKSAIFLDARLSEDYEAEHITGAMWLCYESVEEDYAKVMSQLPKDRLLITYCSDQQCASAIKLADALVARGHTRVVIMLEGLPGWKDAGYPTTTGREAGG